MPLGPQDTEEGARQLAARLAALERRLANTPVRHARTGQRRNPRLTITCADPSTGVYPTEESCPNVYWIRFVDGTALPLSHSERQSEGNQFTLAMNLWTGKYTYVATGTRILVASDRTPDGKRQWWFNYAKCPPSTCTAFCDGGAPENGWAVTLGGVPAKNCFVLGTNCSQVNDTFVVDDYTDHGHYCEWLYAFPIDGLGNPYGCQMHSIGVKLLQSSGEYPAPAGNYIMIIAVAGLQEYAILMADFGASPPKCKSLADVATSTVRYEGVGGYYSCDLSNLTAVVNPA